MKKIVSLIIAMGLILSLAACGSSKGGDKDTADSKKESTSGNAEISLNTGEELNQVEKVFYPSTSGCYATVKISADVKFDDESAWLGLCPAGVTYIREIEADEVDVIWFGYEYREDGDPYVYACDFESVEDGTYALVVCSSDNEEYGYVMIQLEMTKKDDKLEFNYKDAKFNERPSK